MRSSKNAHFIEKFGTFKDFCREAAEELMMVVGLVEENE